MRVDNDGEGGILALMSLLGVKKQHRPAIVAVGLFGAALIYGDGAITPAISVLSALEGLEHRDAGASQPYVLPAAVVDSGRAVRDPAARARRGSARRSARSCWSGSSSSRCSGIWGIAQHPSVLAALNPAYGLSLSVLGRLTGFLVLGGVFLCVTGAEALYADMGHFGARPDPARLVRRGVSEPGPELCRPGGARARRRADRRQHLLSRCARKPLLDAARRAGDDRDDHRQPVDHHRRLLDDAAGDPARLAAAPARSSRPPRRATDRSMSASSIGC